MEPIIKIDGKYQTVTKLVKELGTVTLNYCENNNSIQVRDKNGKWLGNLKYDWSESNAAETVSGGTGAKSA